MASPRPPLRRRVLQAARVSGAEGGGFCPPPLHCAWQSFQPPQCFMRPCAGNQARNANSTLQALSASNALARCSGSLAAAMACQSQRICCCVYSSEGSCHERRSPVCAAPVQERPSPPPCEEQRGGGGCNVRALRNSASCACVAEKKHIVAQQTTGHCKGRTCCAEQGSGMAHVALA